MTAITSASLAEQVAGTRPADWTYTAEGGANIVVSYAGHASPLLYGKVLRLRKRKNGGETTAGRVDLRFAKEVIEPLLGMGTVVKMAILSVAPDFLVGLRDHLQQTGARPQERVEVDEIDVSLEEVVLTDDLVRGADVLAIEIKVRLDRRPCRDCFLSDTSRGISQNGASCRTLDGFHQRLHPSSRIIAGSACTRTSNQARKGSKHVKSGIKLLTVRSTSTADETVRR
jgi:hypothetical protein